MLLLSCLSFTLAVNLETFAYLSVRACLDLMMTQERPLTKVDSRTIHVELQVKTHVSAHVVIFGGADAD